jgi:hypothetical protein
VKAIRRAASASADVIIECPRSGLRDADPPITSP